MSPIPRWIVAASISLVWLSPSNVEGDEPRADRVVADFDGLGFPDGWAVEGSAFGDRPARGALSGQMEVTGFDGDGLLSSFHGGDDAEGVATSPPFRVDRRHLNFLIGGGGYPGETCVQLVIDGVPVCEAIGPNTQPGGSERLEWRTWDLGAFDGREATIRAVDHRKGGWGHISLDRVTLSDAMKGLVPSSRRVVADRPFLLLPVEPKNPPRRVKVSGESGEVVREFDIRLAHGPGEFRAFLDLGPFRGRALTLSADLPGDSNRFDSVALSDVAIDAPKAYTEADRPGFHFTARRGWLNDPNGLVWHEGRYHLFYQHNPYGWDWGNMHWGHATSLDLVHWDEQPEALYPRKYGDWAFSGSAVVDKANTSGFGKDGKGPMVLAFTSTGRGECIAFSNDSGRTWAEFAGNPVVKHDGRDPRLVWHEPTRRWIMAVYDETDGARSIVFHSSADLKTWTEESRVGGYYECPDLYEIDAEGSNPPRKYWVLSGADGKYQVGDFDGHKFTPKTEKQTLWHGDFYAAQTFSDEPGGRRIQVGWARDVTFPGMPFNQQMTFPAELRLWQVGDKLWLTATPVDEIIPLYGRVFSALQRMDFAADSEGVLSSRTVEEAEGLDLRFTIKGGAGDEVTATFYGSEVKYDGPNRMLKVAGLEVPFTPLENLVELRVLADKRSIEVFLNGGEVAASRRIVHKSGAPALVLEAKGNGRRARMLRQGICEVQTSWPTGVAQKKQRPVFIESRLPGAPD